MSEDKGMFGDAKEVVTSTVGVGKATVDTGKATGKAIKSIDDFFAHGNSRVIGPLVTVSLKAMRELFSRAYRKAVGTSVEVREPEDMIGLEQPPNDDIL